MEATNGSNDVLVDEHTAVVWTDIQKNLPRKKRAQISLSYGGGGGRRIDKVLWRSLQISKDILVSSRGIKPGYQMRRDFGHTTLGEMRAACRRPVDRTRVHRSRCLLDMASW
jgi:hypothetical protein